MNFKVFDVTQSQQQAITHKPSVGNNVLIYQFSGAVDENKLQRTVQTLIENCAPFSYRFLRVFHSIQLIQSSVPPEGLRCLDIQHEGDLRKIAQQNFQLDGASPYAWTLARLGTVHFLIFCSHPALMDRHSLKPLIKSFQQIYQDQWNGEALGLSQESLLKSENHFLGKPEYQESLRFWAQVTPAAPFEWNPPRLKNAVIKNRFSVPLGLEVATELKKLAQTLKTTTHCLFSLGLHLVLAKTSQSEMVATSFRSRTSSEGVDKIGYDENKFFFKSLISPEMKTSEFLRRGSRLYEQIKNHTRIAELSLKEEIRRRDPHFKRVTNVFIGENELPAENLVLDPSTEGFLLSEFCDLIGEDDIAIYFDASDDMNLTVAVKNPQALASVQLTIEHLKAVLSHLPAQLQQPLKNLNYFNTELRKKAMAFADGGTLPHSPVDALQMIAGWAKKNPELPALAFKEKKYSYEQLFKSSMGIAKQLSLYKSEASSLIGICLPRSEQTVLSILGILSSGQGYVPMDVDLPPERLKYLIEDSGVKAVIVNTETKSLLDEVTSCPLLLFDDLLEEDSAIEVDFSSQGSNTACVIYTSGTTGNPKGVVVTRDNLAHLMATAGVLCPRGPGYRFMQFSSFSFDASILSLFNPLVSGSEVVIAPSESRTDPEAIYEILLKEKITHIDLPPALLPLLPRRPLPDMRMVMVGGEAADEEAVRFWSRSFSVVNCYGPTETTVICTWNILGGTKANNELGRPIPGYFIYLLDENGELAPLGGIGEICVAGGGVTKEYLGRPELTQKSFVKNKWGHGNMYHTGDLGRFLPNGDIEFLGRKDFQVKIRGFRIELGEIEAAIAEQPEVQQTYVTVVEKDGSKSLAAWYLAKNLSVGVLRERLSSKLPYYMIPSYLIAVDEFPLNSNGKIDRKKLSIFNPTQDSNVLEMMNDFQKSIREIWAEVLKVPILMIHRQSDFFHLGGHSLMASVVCTRISKKLGIQVKPRLLFENSVFNHFCKKLESQALKGKIFKLITKSDAQEATVEDRMIDFMFSRTASLPGDNTYNIVSRIRFSEGIESDLLKEALQQTLNENPIFNAHFVEKNGRLQIQASSHQAYIPIVHASEADIPSRLEAFRETGFELSKSPLWKCEIVKTEALGCILLFSIHHSIFDGWSLNLLMHELAERYTALQTGKKFQSQNLNFFDYSLWCDGIQETSEFIEATNYWKQKLDGSAFRVELPFEFSQKRANSNQSLPVQFTSATTLRLKEMAAHYGVTLSPLLFSLFLTWLWRITGQEEFVIGYPYAGRDHPGLESMYGYFVKMGLLKGLLKPQQDLKALALNIHRQMLEDRDHFTAAPYDTNLNGLEAMNVIFSLQSGIEQQGKMGSSTFDAEELSPLSSKADLIGVFYENWDQTLSGRIEYDGSLFREETMSSFVRSFQTLVESSVEKFETRLSEIKYLTNKDQAELSRLSLGPQKPVQDQNFVSQFSNIVRRHKDKIALIDGDLRWTYTELDQKSTEIAESLASQIIPGEFVGLCMDKKAETIASIFALLKLGAVYVPMDPTYPLERIQFFIENCQIQKVIADVSAQEKLKYLPLKNLEFVDLFSRDKSYLPADIAPESLAYIIHTSGTTGHPKGVMIEQRNLVRIAESVAKSSHFELSDIFPLCGSLSFDITIIEIFVPLLNGGTLVIAPEAVRKDAIQLHKFFKENHISSAIVPPAMLQSFPREPLPDLRILGFGGDTIDAATADWWSRHTRLFTHYGPTEITVQCSSGEILPGSHSRVIGTPGTYYHMYLLNSQKQWVPKGAIGEIYIGGEQCARGYINRQDLTNERFLLDSFSDSPYAMMYKTGDLGRFLSDGSIEYHGRNDLQVKVRGVRIELGEIESHLSHFPEIQQVVVAAKGEGQNRYLAAYYVSPKEFNSEELRQYLKRSLPETMIPSFFVKLNQLPLLANGKLNRQALPTITELAAKNPPQTRLEKDICKIWEDVLRLKGISRDESFFHLGGNSLLAVRLQTELYKKIAMDVTMADLYAHPTIESLAAKKSVNFIDLAVKDAEVGIGLHSQASAWIPSSSPQKILLTGAKGFLGIFLLAELADKAKQIYCLLRCSDAEAGKQMLLQESISAGLSIDFQKVTVIPGDLSKPHLGLQSELWENLAHQIDSILHCGAFVHHLHNYQMMKPTNVDGTRELLKLALHVKQIPFCFVSTQSVGDYLEASSRVEEKIISNRPTIQAGYILTKWVGEQLVNEAHRKYGLPVVIARPGNITGSSKNGYSNYAGNHFWLFNQGCFQLGAFPKDMNQKIEMTPVDILAQHICALALNPKVEILVANLSNPHSITQEQFLEFADGLGLPAKEIPAAEWQHLLHELPEGNGLEALRDFYLGELTGHQIPVAREKTLQRLLEVQGLTEVSYSRLLPLYFEYLKKEGFLKPIPSNESQSIA